jgi:hypothetical protein
MMAVSHLKPLLFKWRYLVGWMCMLCEMSHLVHSKELDVYPNFPSSPFIHWMWIKCPIQLTHSLDMYQMSHPFNAFTNWMQIKCHIHFVHSLDVNQMSHLVNPFTWCVSNVPSSPSFHSMCLGAHYAHILLFPQHYQQKASRCKWSLTKSPNKK